MSRNKFEFISGLILIIVVLPPLGISAFWKTIIIVIIGLLFICIAALDHLRHQTRTHIETSASEPNDPESSFVENPLPSESAPASQPETESDTPRV